MKIKATVEKSIKVNAGPYRVKSFQSAIHAARFYSQCSNFQCYNEPVTLSPAQIAARYDRLYRRVLPIFKQMLKG